MASFDKVIPPGQEGKIILEVDAAKIHGEFNKSATVITNDPTHSRMTLTIAGKIVPYIEIEPSTRIYLRGGYGEIVEKEVTIKLNEKLKKFEIVEVTSNLDDKITYKLAPAEGDGNYTLKIWKNPKMPTMNTWGTIFLHTNSEIAPEKILQINVTAIGSIVCQPTTLNFGTVEASGGANLALKPRELALTIFKTQGDFKIKDVTFSSNVFDAKVSSVEAGRKYMVTVSFHPGAEKKNYIDEMIINTDDPQEPSVRVRLLARAL